MKGSTLASNATKWRRVRPGALLLMAIALGVLPTSLSAQSDPVDVLNGDIPEPGTPGIAGDTVQLGPSEDTRRRVELGADAAKFWGEGYPQPDVTDLDAYNANTIEQVTRNLKKIDDPCEKAVYLKHALDASQDDYVPLSYDMQSHAHLAEIGIEIANVALPTNPFDITKALKDVVTNPSKGVSELKVASAILNIATVVKALGKIPTGSLSGHIGRYKLQIYETARQENWSPQQIDDQRRQMYEQTQQYSQEVADLKKDLEQKAEDRRDQHFQRMAEIDEDYAQELRDLEADKAVNGEYERRKQRVQDPEFVKTLVIGSEVSAENPDFGQRQFDAIENYINSADDYYSEAKSTAWQAAQIEKINEVYNFNEYVLLLAKTTNAEMAKRLAYMQILEAQSETLKTYAKPVAAGECETLRKPDPAMNPDAVEAAIIDRIKQLDAQKFDALVSELGAEVPGDFYGCLCARNANGGVGGGWTIDGGKCYSVGVLGGKGEVDMSGPGTKASWEGCLDKLQVPAADGSEGIPILDLLVDRLRQEPGRAIGTAGQ